MQLPCCQPAMTVKEYVDGSAISPATVYVAGLVHRLELYSKYAQLFIFISEVTAVY